MSTQFFVVIGLLVVLALVIVFGNRKKKWYKVYTANDDIMCVYRKQDDYWLGENIKDMITAHEVDGTTVYIPKHWIIKVKRINENQVDEALKEIEVLHKAVE